MTRISRVDEAPSTREGVELGIWLGIGTMKLLCQASNRCALLCVGADLPESVFGAWITKQDVGSTKRHEG